MGTKMGKSKARARRHRLKEREKVDSGIFDEKTMVNLGKFFNKGIIGKLEFNIARGRIRHRWLKAATATRGPRIGMVTCMFP